MSELIVIGYGTPEKAEEARAELFGMSREYLVDVADAVVATADEKGRVKLNQMVNLWTVGGTGGAFWGLLAGMLFFHPLVGLAVGAGAGALAGAMSDYGLNDDFMKQVAEVLAPGQAALFIMTRETTTERVIEQLGRKGGHIIRTNLDHSQEDRLKRAFNAAHAEELKAQNAEAA
ncbi:DUF1269 domain-containing protein [Frigidibacter sp. ROC022]|uniref:DUF1269 domain-containing protein n=1 Tax=Frigidibacter sp. ROC022 TaxID=2971796 RepID=UPI00215A7967|nr:DUF1269 domain-containing protein [Frigidibacter sp. ROC022]MCR8725735.1 DUF1269 domain-containing protein [Frigidibacter sp. ROC022]